MPKELPPGKGGQPEFGEHHENDNVTPTPQTGEGGLHIGVPSNTPGDQDNPLSFLQDTYNEVNRWMQIGENRANRKSETPASDDSPTTPVDSGDGHSMFPQLASYLANRDKKDVSAEIVDDQRTQALVDHFMAKSLSDFDGIPDGTKLREMITDAQVFVNMMSREERSESLQLLEKEKAEIAAKEKRDHEVAEVVFEVDDDEEDAIDEVSTPTADELEKWLSTAESDVVGTDYDKAEDFRVDGGPLAGLQRVGKDGFWMDYTLHGRNKDATTEPQDIQDALDKSRKTQDQDNVLWIFGDKADENVKPPDDEGNPEGEEQAS